MKEIFEVEVKYAGAKFLDGTALYEVSIKANYCEAFKCEITANSEEEAVEKAFPLYFEEHNKIINIINKHFQQLKAA